MSTKILVRAIFGVIAAIAFAIMGWRAARRMQAAEAAGGCVVCGSTNVHRTAEALTCLACGYVGQADRGGALTDDDFDSVYGEVSATEHKLENVQDNIPRAP